MSGVCSEMHVTIGFAVTGGIEFHESTLPAMFPHGSSAQQVSGT